MEEKEPVEDILEEMEKAVDRGVLPVGFHNISVQYIEFLIGP